MHWIDNDIIVFPTKRNSLPFPIEEIKPLPTPATYP